MLMVLLWNQAHGDDPKGGVNDDTVSHPFAWKLYSLGTCVPALSNNATSEAWRAARA